MIVIKSIPHEYDTKWIVPQNEILHGPGLGKKGLNGWREWYSMRSAMAVWGSGGGRLSVDGCKLDPRVPDTRKAATRTIVLWLNDGTDGDELERVSKVRIPSVLHKALFVTPICMHSGYKATFFIQGLSKGWFTRIERFERIETRKDKIQKQLWL